MPVSLPHPDEQQRLAALRRYGLLGTPPEESFDRITRLAARLFEVPIALITLVAEEQLWSKSRFGTDAQEIDRHLSFCTHNIEQDGVMVVEDAWADARFDGNPLVHDDPGIRFYAGAPLITHDGYCLGSLCVHDVEPRALEPEEEALLKDLAAEVMDEIELRLSLPEGGKALYADKALLASVIDVQNEIAGTSLSSQETMALVVRRAREITGADGACLLEGEGEEVRVRAACGAALYPDGVRYEEAALCRTALTSGEVLVVGDVQEDQRASAARRAGALRSAVLVPFRAGGRVAGVLEVAARRPHALGEKHAQALELLAEPIEAALGRARTSKALRESTRRHRSLLEHLPVGVYRTTPDGRLLEANTAMADLLGYDSVEALLEQRVPDLYLNDEDRLRDLRQLGGQKMRNAEFPLRRADGEVVWVRDYPKAVSKGKDSEVTHFDGVLVDITKRKRAEEQLSESEARLQALVENISDLIEVIDAEGVVQYVSGAVKELTGFRRDEALGHHAFERVHPDDLPELKAKMEELLRHPGALIEHEYRHQHRNGDWRYFSVRGRNFLGYPGVDGLLGTVRDVTARKQFEQELIEAKEEAEEMARLKTTFLANMSHEIRTPLASVLGFADVLAEEVKGQEREFAQLISESGQRLSRTLNSVLELARLESGGVDPELGPVSARSVLEEAAELFAPVAEEKGLFFELDLPEEELTFRAERSGVGRMLSNLLSNAIKFTEEGRITVQARRDDDAVQVRVSDTGRGMDEAFQEDLFDEFRQESEGLDRSHEGVGLGLAITRRLAEVMGAAVEVESQKGVGSTFTLTFPRLEKHPEPEAGGGESLAASLEDENHLPIEGKEEAPEGMGGRVLIAEDDADARRLLEHLLPAPWEATVAASASAFLEAAAGNGYDAVLIDTNLGKRLGGEDVLQRLRADDRYADVSAVALTAYAMPGDEEHFLNVGFDHYLAKPFTRKELSRVLEDAAA